jgi:predicted nucleic acid-binding protein
MADADLDAALSGVDRILIDSSALIAFHNPNELAHPLAKHLMERVEDATDLLRAYYSVISATELLEHPIKSGDHAFTLMHAFLTSFPNLTALPVDFTVAMQAASIRAATGIRVPDALIVATGLQSGCEAIVSNDHQWSGKLAPLFPAIRWLHISDCL